MVYGKFFYKPFSKTRVRLPLESRLSLCSLSFSLCFLLFIVPNHPQPPLAPQATSLSLSPSSFPANPEPPRFLSHRSLCSHRSHSKRPPSIRRTDLYLTDLILIWSDQILIWSDLISFFFFLFDILDLLILFSKHNDIWELFI